MKKVKIFAFLVVVVVLCPCLGNAATILIPEDIPTIQEAVDVASDGDLILVEPGTYAENVMVFNKSIQLESVAGPEETIIEGHTLASVITFFACRRWTVISGFTIRYGVGTWAFGEKKRDFALYGGGVFCVSSSPEISNCIITENTAMKGAGIHCYSDTVFHSEPIIINCTFSYNDADFTGGGIDAGEYSSPIIINCSVFGNTVGEYGGGIYAGNYSRIYNSIIAENEARVHAGIFAWDNCIVERCRISNNHAIGHDNGGGGVGASNNTMIRNCEITQNTAEQGAGVYLSGESTLINCTIVGNIAEQNAGGILCWGNSPIIANCILWENSAPEGPQIYIGGYADPLTISYSDVQGGEAGVFVETGTLSWEEGNIDADPLFILPGSNYHLRPGSPCIDAGTDAGVYTDIDGQTRPWGAGFDMGSDEFSTEPCSTIASSGNQFLALYLIPALALIVLSRRFLRR